MNNIYIYVYLKEGPVPAGVLEIKGEGTEATASFRYGQRYLQRHDRLAIDPIQLPLHEPDSEHTYWLPEGFTLFNGIRDATPDGWGRYLMDRAAESHILSEYDYLLASGEDRVGALAFGPNLSGPHRITPWQEDKLLQEHFDLAKLLTAAQELDSSSDLPPEHRHFLFQGSSLGGARPKATTEIENKQWIAKFSRASDRYPICRAEYATMQLAAKAGLHIPAVRIEKILEQDIYLIERFDRLPTAQGYQRIPFISALTLTGAHESESSKQSYRSIADQLRLYGTHFKEDTRELWCRMIFNILCNNTDDHLRNHGFLWDGKGWRLSPAYDIVPFPQVGTDRYLAIGVGQNGRQATLANALSETASFGLTKDEGINLATKMQGIVKTEWQKIFTQCGFTAVEIEKLSSCFIATLQ